MKTSVWSAVALALAALGPAACSETPDEAAAPAAPEGIAVTNARLMLPAVEGNPGAVYFDVANSGAENRVIRAAAVAGAGSATVHTTSGEMMLELPQVLLTAGETVKFEPGGRHVMANNLAGTVTAGGSADVTLTFLGGATMTFPAEVRAAGDER